MKRQLRSNNEEAKEQEMLELIDQLRKDVGYADLVFNFAEYFGTDEVLTALREMTVYSHRDHLY